MYDNDLIYYGQLERQWSAMSSGTQGLSYLAYFVAQQHYQVLTLSVMIEPGS